MVKVELYEHTYKRKKHFSFGQNWKEYLNSLNEDKINEAKKSLTRFLGGKDKIRNKTFVDIGCGSGLFSLAAFLLGAKKVVSVDIDDASLYCVNTLRKKYSSNPDKWVVKKGSALDKSFMKRLGKFDIVYSWGVLHHTGNMYQAFDNLTMLSHEKSIIYLAIYNNNRIFFEGTSPFWLKIKKIYNSSNKIIKKCIYYIYTLYLIFGITVSGKNTIKYIKDYHTLRGMNFFTDIKDWLGGYPYEYASTQEITDYFKNLGYIAKKISKARSLGCNEYLIGRL
jgi:2-polyprenyl-6-hydroxyphenyl methylase/3-demethylubiquinone-9 3-methyltransferase